MDPNRDIPEHEHTHSVWVRCLHCKMWGIPGPSKFIKAVPCGNCNSLETVKYYPSCCILADREKTDIDSKLRETIAQIWAINADVINGLHRRFYREAEFDARRIQKLIQGVV